MPVITVTTTKGGAGKTTATLLLACEIAESGATVTVIDADPNQPMVNWGSGGHVPSGMSISGGVNEASILDAIEEASKTSKFVIVDLEGSANLSMAHAVGMSNLVLLPTQGSVLDAKETSKTIALLSRLSRTLPKPVNTRVFWQRANALIEPRSAKAIRIQMEEAGIPILKTKLVEREAYKAMFDYQVSLSALREDEAPSLDKARANALKWVEEVLGELSRSREGQGTAHSKGMVA